MVNLTNRKGEKIMNARYANLRNFNRTVKTYKWLVDLFGNKEFTSEDFTKAKHNYKRYTYNSLSYLRDEGIIKAVRTEQTTKEIKLHPWEAEIWMIDKDGNALMTEYDWMRLPEVAQNALRTMNGQNFRTERKDTKTVEAEKCFYTINPDGMLAWRKRYGNLLAVRADKIAGEIAKLTEKKEAMIACQI